MNPVRTCCSNYPKTRISLTSTLNMKYLDTLGAIDNRTAGHTGRLIRHSLVRQVFEDLGYTSVALETDFYWTEWENAELFLSRKTPGIVAAAQHLEEVIPNAYFLPGEGRASLYPTITPVNTFRLIFDTCFGSHIGLLEDVSYHSTAGDPSGFTVYPDDRPGCEAP